MSVIDIIPHHHIKSILSDAINTALNEILNTSDAKLYTQNVQDIAQMIAKPKEISQGDWSFPCFRYNKLLKDKPGELAIRIKKYIEAQTGLKAYISEVKIISNFVNIYLNNSKLTELVFAKFTDNTVFNVLSKDKQRIKENIMIEYGQPNTHKGLHVGHARNTFLGNSLVRIFRYCGYKVNSVNYYGDEGTHIAKALWYLRDECKITDSKTCLEYYSKDSVKYFSAEKKEDLLADVSNKFKGEWLGNIYAKANNFLAGLDPESQKLANEKIGLVLRDLEEKNEPMYSLWKETRGWSLDYFKMIYKEFNIEFDQEFFESEVSEQSQLIVDEYYKKGVFKAENGAIGVDLSDYKLGYFIARKSDGNTLYATKDLVLAKKKFVEYNVDRSIYVVANAQDHHFKQVFKVLEMMGFEQAKQCYHLSYGLVMLPEGKMSSRSGNSVLFEDLRKMVNMELSKILETQNFTSQLAVQKTVSTLCNGIIKYGMLSCDPNKKITFKVEDWVSFEGNTGAYLMYSYARIQSILRKTNYKFNGYNSSKYLTEEIEFSLLAYIYDFDSVVLDSCERYKPSIVSNHLYEMCRAFNKFYAQINIAKTEDKNIKNARLELIDVFAQTLKQGLALLGIIPPNKM